MQEIIPCSCKVSCPRKNKLSFRSPRLDEEPPEIGYNLNRPIRISLFKRTCCRNGLELLNNPVLARSPDLARVLTEGLHLCKKLSPVPARSPVLARTSYPFVVRDWTRNLLKLDISLTVQSGIHPSNGHIAGLYVEQCSMNNVFRPHKSQGTRSWRPCGQEPRSVGRPARTKPSQEQVILS